MPFNQESINEILSWQAFATYTDAQKETTRELLSRTQISHAQMDILFGDSMSGMIHSTVLDSKAGDEEALSRLESETEKQAARQLAEESAKFLGKILANVTENINLNGAMVRTPIIRHIIGRLGEYNDAIVADVIALTRNHIQFLGGKTIEPSAGEADEADRQDEFLLLTFNQTHNIFWLMMRTQINLFTHIDNIEPLYINLINQDSLISPEIKFHKLNLLLKEFNYPLLPIKNILEDYQQTFFYKHDFNKNRFNINTYNIIPNLTPTIERYTEDLERNPDNIAARVGRALRYLYECTAHGDFNGALDINHPSFALAREDFEYVHAKEPTNIIAIQALERMRLSEDDEQHNSNPSM